MATENAISLKHNADIEDREIDQSSNEQPQTFKSQSPWSRLKGSIWDTWDKSPEERKLVQKVDWWLLSYACTAYFIKSLDQSNVRNDPDEIDGCE